MPKYVYSFTHSWSKGGRKILSGRIHLPVRFTNPGTGVSHRCYGLLDTGADNSMFPGAMAQHLGHKLKGEGVRDDVLTGIGLKKVPTWAHTFKISLLSPDGDRDVWVSDDVSIHCAEQDVPILLGISEFLNHFTVCACYRRHTVTISW